MTAATLDANILSSAALSNSTPPGRILDACFDGWFDLILSDHVVAETERTLAKGSFRTRLSDAELAGFLSKLIRRAIIVPLTVTVQGVATHPEDD